MKMVVLCVATLWVTTKNAPFSDRNKVFQAFLKTFEIASEYQTNLSAIKSRSCGKSVYFKILGTIQDNGKFVISSRTTSA